MQALTMDEVEHVGGGKLTAGEGAGLIIAVACICLTPITIGVALGAAAGLVIADALAN
jgi:hypothetical protein